MRIAEGIIPGVLRKFSISNQFRIAVLDQEAASLMMRSRLEYDLEIPRAPTLKETLQRGLSLICIGTPHTVSRVLTSHEITSLNIETCRIDLSRPI